MCTAVSLRTDGLYFGRTLDLEYHYKESVTVMPRRFPLAFRHMPSIKEHYAIIGMATVADGYALYYDAMNEKGLCIAGLNFPNSAHYGSYIEGMDNPAAFELIPWVLAQCENVGLAAAMLANVNVTDDGFSDSFRPTPLHWMIADREQCIVAEPTADGLKLYDNPVGVLTNEPSFPFQLHNLNNYMALSPDPPVNHFQDSLDLKAYSRGMGALGMPGDLSSQSRFVRAAFARCNSICGYSEEESVGHFFRIMGTVTQPRGCVRLGDKYVTTVYTSCCCADKGIYYYSTYDNPAVRGVDMHRESLDGEVLVSYPMDYEGHLETIN